eukprot:jgi/Mesen1/7409/ME000388S06627
MWRRCDILPPLAHSWGENYFFGVCRQRNVTNEAAGSDRERKPGFASEEVTHVSLPALTPSTGALADGLLAGELSALSRSITLCESSRPDHRAQAAALLQHLLQKSPNIAARSMFRVGVTGPPGAGKSSVIERLGLMAAEEAGERVAVLAIDPSSSQRGQGGGSILGDKTRMDELARHPRAFVRPTPSRGHVGGIARSTADSALLCELPQRWSAISPQGVLPRVVEVADMVAVNKADGDMWHSAQTAVAEYRNALHFLRPRSPFWSPPVSSWAASPARGVVACSARTGAGMGEVWQRIRAFERAMGTAGELQARRAAQSRHLLWSNVTNELVERMRSDAKLSAALEAYESQVAGGTLASRAAAFHIANSFLLHKGPLLPPSS